MYVPQKQPLQFPAQRSAVQQKWKLVFISEQKRAEAERRCKPGSTSAEHRCFTQMCLWRRTWSKSAHTRVCVSAGVQEEGRGAISALERPARMTTVETRFNVKAIYCFLSDSHTHPQLPHTNHTHPELMMPPASASHCSRRLLCLVLVFYFASLLADETLKWMQAFGNRHLNPQSS